MKTLRIGSTGKDVERWEYFLRGKGYYISAVDGKFDKSTAEATKLFQAKNKLTSDGVVGNNTFAKAMLQGFEIIEDTDDGKNSANWPPPPDFKAVVGQAGRDRVFGKIEFKPSGNPKNPEGVTITNDWSKDNLTKVVIPQLIGINGAPKNGEIFFHVKGAKQLQNLFAAWEKAGLMPLVLGWAGSWAPRFIRGSYTVLSNHAYATAFDINVPWNGLGVRPALVGEKGSVRELVPLANKHGFYWGGHFSKRPDGMHFELAKIL